MKRFIMFCIMIITFVGCSPNISQRPEFLEEVKRNIQVLEYEGCEYIISTYTTHSGHGGYGFMSHKGNCKNFIHKHNKE